MTPTPDTTTDVPVLIVGAGPAGLTTAITLARYGIESLVVDRRGAASAQPRATTVSTRTMELMRAWGLEEELRAGGDDVEWLGWSCATLADVALGTPFAVGFPTREQSAAVSPTAPAAVPQDHLEPVLLAHLRSLGPARVALGVELLDVASAPDGVRARVQDVASGRTCTVAARYVVGADGVRSRMRAALGIAMRGPDRLAEGFSALFRAPLWELVGPHRYGLYDLTHPSVTGSSCRPARATAGSTAPCAPPPRVLSRISPTGRSSSASGSAPGGRPCGHGSSGWAGSPMGRSSPTPSGGTAPSWSATRRTGSRRAARRG